MTATSNGKGVGIHEAEAEEFTKFALQYINNQRDKIGTDFLTDAHEALAVTSEGAQLCFCFTPEIPLDFIVEFLIPRLILKRDIKWMALTSDAHYCPPEHEVDWNDAGCPPLAEWPNARECLKIDIECQHGGFSAIVKYNRVGDDKTCVHEKTQLSYYAAHRGLNWFNKSLDELLENP